MKFNKKKTPTRGFALLLCGLFLGFLTLTGLGIVFTPDRDFSPNENRYLQTRPAISWEGILSGKVQNELTDWFSDQFPGRDGLASLRTLCLKLLGRKDNGEVYFGKDHYYFEKLTENDFNHSRYTKNLGYIADLAAEHSSTPITLLLAPSSGTVNSDLLPDYLEYYNADRCYSEAAERLEGCTVLDIRQQMAAAKADTQLYYRTDHHWTTRGAAIAYAAFAESAGFAPLAPEYTTVSTGFYGTLYSKALDRDAQPDTIELATPDTLTATADGSPIAVYDRTALEEKDHYKVFFGGNYGQVTLTGGCKNGKTIVVIKDSYANCFVPFLAAHYEKVMMIDLRYYTDELSALLAEERPAQLLFLYEMGNFADDKNLAKLGL